MPLIIENDIPAWRERNSLRSTPRAGSYSRADCIDIALINNMPDSALEDTELQFFELLDAASGDVPVRIQLYSLPQLPRGDRAQEHLRSFYHSTHDLLNRHLDAAIITGTEPRQPHLQDEPYWPALTEVLDWAEHNTVSTVLSCLAAHASVLHSDGIKRYRLGDKCFGVFDYKKVRDHALTAGTPSLIQIPHSRWNEVREDALTNCGYDILTRSPETGADLFVKKKKRSLFVYFQGHPEYQANTLQREYQRDIKRFLRKERETYPSIPVGYFDAAAAEILNHFRKNAESQPREEVWAEFPEAAIAAKLQNTWQPSANRVYRNWLQYVSSRKTETSALADVSRSRRG